MRARQQEPASNPLMQDILRYLIAHPQAKDTLEGIIAWWCPKSRIECGKAEVQEVLDQLVSRGWLMERESRPVQTIYGLNKERREEIELFLQRL